MAYKDKADTIRYNNDFNKKNYDRINLTMKKGKKELIQRAAQIRGESVNTFINNLIDKELKKI